MLKKTDYTWLKRVTYDEVYRCDIFEMNYVKKA